ncbi:MAG: hypothetical protein WBA91_06135 [Paracoccaceae bacterium]
MSFLRPEARATLGRWVEPAAAFALGLLGLWIGFRGGYLLTPLGAAIGLVAAGWLILALRRLHFHQFAGVPGLVEFDEGQIGYLGPEFGGYVALADLSEVQVLDYYGRRHWRLRQLDGQAILIPHGAAGTEILFDAFATLPGADMRRFARASEGASTDITVWRRPAELPLT